MLFSFLPRICICITKHFQYHDKFHNKRLNKTCNWQQFFHFFFQKRQAASLQAASQFFRSSWRICYRYLYTIIYTELILNLHHYCPCQCMSYFFYFYLIYEEQTVLKEEISVKLWKRQLINKLLKLCISHESYNNNRST